MDLLPASRPPGPAPIKEIAAFVRPALLAYGLLVLLLLLRHELWQDEWQAWLLARDSASLPELFRNLRYEGHPGLWHLGLYLLSRVSPHPLGMQLFHLLLAASSAYIFLKYSPFTRAQKLLFLGGYFPFYEYAVISRNYALGVLGVFAFCALCCRAGRRNYPLLGLVLFLLCQTSVYGLMLALVLGVTLLWAAIRDRAGAKEIIIAALALVLGAGLSVLQVKPPADSGFAVGWKFDLDFPYLLKTLAAVWRSYAPLPAAQYHFWGSNFIPGPSWQALLAVLLLAGAAALFSRRPPLLFLYAAGTGGLLAFAYVKYPGSIRHHGHYYLLLIAALWLCAAFPAKRKEAHFPACRRGGLNLVLTVLLAVHLAAGVWAASLDLVFPFSESKNAARFIKDRQMAGMLLVGHADDAASGVAGWLNRPVYYPARRGWGTFIIWNRERKADLPLREVVAQALELSRSRGQDVLLVLNCALPPNRFPVRLLKSCTRSLVPEENYFLYLAPKPAD